MKGKKKIKVGTAVKMIILCAGLILSIYPIIWLILSSLKTNVEIYNNPWGFPEVFQFCNYSKAWLESGINRAFFNSIFVCVIALAGVVICSCMLAFALTRLKFKLSPLIMGFVLLVMMIPANATLAPLFLTYSKMKLINTYWSLIFSYVTFTMPISIFILTGFMKGISQELEEAAIIDGASMEMTFLKVIIPICKPSIATVAIYSFVSMWNDLVYALTFMNKMEMYTIPVILTTFKSQYSIDYVVMMAAISIAVIPVIILYVIFNKQITSGLTAGAVKG